MNAAEELLTTPLAAGDGDRPALVFGDRTVSYATLRTASARFANLWRSLGLAPGDAVLLLGRDRPELYFAYLGAMLAGVVPAALSLRMGRDELAAVLAASGARRMLVDADLLPAVQAAGPVPPLMTLDRPVPGLPWAPEEAEAMPASCEVHQAAADAPALRIYTSGTTGRPKGVVHAQRAVLAGRPFMREVLGVRPGERIFCTSKLFFAYALGHALFGALAAQATVILHPDWPEPEAVTAVVRTHAPDVVFSVPALYRNVLRAGLAADPVWRRVGRYVAAGERLPESLWRAWWEATGRGIVEGIGASETLFLFLSHRPDDVRPGRTGRPTPGTEVVLRDEGGREIREDGRPGVMWVRMASVALGYHGDAARSAETFCDGWYRTGDMFVREPDGWYRHVGRADDMLKVSGQWVSPTEIEEVAQTVTGVAEAAAVGVTDRDGLTRVALFVVPVAPGEDAAALREQVTAGLAARLPRHKCPRRIHLVDELPRTATGKVRRVVLRERAAELERVRGNG